MLTRIIISRKFVLSDPILSSNQIPNDRNFLSIMPKLSNFPFKLRLCALNCDVIDNNGSIMTTLCIYALCGIIKIPVQKIYSFPFEFWYVFNLDYCCSLCCIWLNKPLHLLPQSNKIIVLNAVIKWNINQCYYMISKPMISLIHRSKLPFSD